MTTGLKTLLGKMAKKVANRLATQTIVGSLGLLAALAAAPAHAGNLDISIGVSGEVSPGVYGRVDIGSAPRYPAVIIDSPVIIHRTHRHLSPVYLHVPPGHARHWDKHCRKYGACETPVYFVRSTEYRDFRPSYIPPRYIYRTETRVYGDDRRGGERYYGRDDRGYERRDGGDYRRDERRDDRREYREDRREDRGHGHGHGHGRGHGRDD